jgi:dGTPase
MREVCATPDSAPWSARLHGDGVSADGTRSSFEVDRDRIVHSATFRDLQYKTQVQSLLNQRPSAVFRTRLNHVLEVAQIARGLARLVGGDEALAEAIALAHDLGHPPFGHAGERALRDALKTHGREGWNANVHSLEVVDRVEVAFVAYRGLNLTFAVREGIARHSTPFDEPASFGEFVTTPNGGLECQIVDVADVFAYLSHDLDDALAGGYLSWEELIELPVMSDLFEFANAPWESGGVRAWPDDERDLLVRKRAVATLLYRLIQDSAAHTSESLAGGEVASPNAVRESRQRLVTPTPTHDGLVRDLLAILTQRYYRSDAVAGADQAAKRLMTAVLDALVADPEMIPPRFRDEDEVIAAATFLASLNDFAAVDLGRRLGVLDPSSTESVA